MSDGTVIPEQPAYKSHRRAVLINVRRDKANEKNVEATCKAFNLSSSDADTLDRIPSGTDYHNGEDYQTAGEEYHQNTFGPGGDYQIQPHGEDYQNAVANAVANANANGNGNANANAIANANANAGHRGDNDSKYFSKTHVFLILLTH